MIPDLGKHSDTVLSAYGISLTLLALVVLISLARGARSKARLARLEKERSAHET